MIEQPPLKLDFRCTTCGYGVARLRPPERVAFVRDSVAAAACDQAPVVMYVTTEDCHSRADQIGAGAKV